MDKAAERRARRAAAARARRSDPAVRAREAEASRDSARRRREDPAVRAREAEAARQRRADPAVREAARQRREADLQNVRQRDAARKRAYRQANEEVRVREAAAKRTKKEHEGADARFKGDFLDVSFGHSCSVCDRLWFSNNLMKISAIRSEKSRLTAVTTLLRAFPDQDATSVGVLLRRCPCGQVLNACTASQAPGWVERREVSIQCGLEEMPPLPLLPETFPSAIRGGSIEEGASSGQGGRLSQGFPVLEDGKDSGTTKAVERRQYFQCPLCPYKTPRSDKLRCHRLSHSIEKPYKCEVCPAAYKYLNNYKSHMCIHTGEVPFRCDLCPFSTIYHMSLQLHRRTHSDAKPFACTMCPFKSRNKADLRIHIGNHRNNKPFKCKVCSFGYGRKWALKVHMQQQHKEA